MRTLVFPFVAALLAGACALTMGRQAAPSRCWPADATTERTIEEIQESVSGADPDGREVMDSLRITATRASDVSYVTDERTCAKAVKVVKVRWRTRISAQVRVYRVGSDYIVETPDRKALVGEYRGLQVYDRRWAYKSTYLTF